MDTVYVRFVRALSSGATELISHTTLPMGAVPRTGDYIDIPAALGARGWSSVVEKITWFYTGEQGVPKLREVASVWVQVSPKERT